ncbi:3-diacetamido-2,3-dideoxy-D-glucuronate 2-epimerase,UDP-2 [Trichinella pseudospiralis]
MPETNSYWLGKGCTKIREPFESIGCTSSSTTHLEAPIGDQISQRARISSGQTMQDICLCNRNYCNASTRPRFSIPLAGSLIIIIIIITIFHYWR